MDRLTPDETVLRSRMAAHLAHQPGRRPKVRKDRFATAAERSRYMRSLTRAEWVALVLPVEMAP